MAVAGGTVIAIGLLVLTAWQSRWDSLVDLHPKFAPMHYNTAFAFVTCGVGLIACSFGWRRLSGIAAAALVAVGVLELLHAAEAIDLGLGTWWLAPPAGMQFFKAGNASATSALCLCLAGLALTLMSWPVSRGATPLLTALLGTVLLFLNLLGAFGFPLAFAFGILPPVAAVQLAFQELVGFVIVGLAVLAYAFRTDLVRTTPRPWLPLFVALSGTTLTVLFWQALTAQESQRLQRLVQFEAVQVQRQLVEGMPLRFQGLVELAQRWQNSAAATAESAEAVDRYTAQHPGCLGVALVAPDQPRHWLGTHDAVRAPSTKPLTDAGPVSDFVNLAAKQGNMKVQRVWQGRANVLAVYTPINSKKPVDGGIIALYRLRDFLDTLLTFNVAHGYAVTLSDGPEQFYSRFGAETPHQDQDGLEGVLRATVLDLDWQLRVWPTRDVMAKEAFGLSKLALIAGFFMSAVLAVAVRLAQTARRRASALEKEICERTQAETALKESEAKYRSLIENLDQSVFLLDRELRYLAANNHFCRDRGCTEADLLGKTDLDLLTLSQSTKHGEELHAVLHEGKKLVLEEPASDNARMVHRVLTPVKDDQGQIVGVLGICWDVTEQRTLETHLRQAQKLEAIGQLAGGVAHDFNNLLTALLGNLELALEELPAEHDVRDMLLSAEKAGRRAAGLTNQLLSFSRQGQMNQQPVDLNALIDEVVALLSRTIDPRIQLDALKDPKLRPVLGDPGQMNQVIMNLCLNARDALAGPGRISLETAYVELDQTFVSRHLEARPGSFVRLRVADTGCGMSPDVQARIFEPFFTTKGLGKGTGLGLATVFGVVKQHQGWIECHSEVNQGTRFDVYFPCVAIVEEPAPPPPSVTDSQLRGHETILVVDDEPLIRQMTSVVLTQRGFRVVEAADGFQAVAKYRNEKDQIDLIILDLTMPKLSGQEAFRQLRQINPHVGVLFASGYTTEHITEEEQGQILGFVKKPFRPHDLVKTVHGALKKVRRGQELPVARC